MSKREPITAQIAWSEIKRPIGEVIGMDDRGVTWVRTCEGTELPIGPDKPRGMSLARKLRLQRTIGWAIALLLVVVLLMRLV
jgi:hypothetical protein